jgi:hypothetical protein
MLNNLPSDYITEGQILRLPSSAKAIQIPEIPPADSKITKNTNQKHYLFDDEDLSPSEKANLKQELRNFISGFDSYIMPAAEPSPQQLPQNPYTADAPQQSSLPSLSGFGIVNKLYGK